MLHDTINITSTKAKLFAIRCGINHTIQLASINYIIVIIDLIYGAKKIFDLSIHLYQIQLSAVYSKLRDFFKRDQQNFIEF